ncbi:NAD-P-binding protein [Mycena venus]|uniref:NAD-P-binding protein n=1 Tax=Mycena venus TaxID=2733690 RepID=A0A8H7D6W6_9AGAR|nr:NAD-P-binding protein [Mycena venus]
MSVVLITGCSVGGIGFTVCTEFANRGCKVYATARKVSKMKPLEALPNVELMTLDVTNDADVLKVVESIIEKQGRIDIIVNNAGMASFGPILEVPIEDIRAVYDTNILSVLRVSRAVLPHMASRNSGLIINISSIVGEIPTPWAGVYASSKAAVHSISEVLQMECRPFNIKVMLVCPGGIKTNVAKNASTHFELPPDSLYKKYLPNIMRRMYASQAPTALSAEEFAKIVAGKASSPYPPFYMTMGFNSGKFAIMKWLPRMWVLNYMWKLLTAPVKQS